MSRPIILNLIEDNEEIRKYEISGVGGLEGSATIIKKNHTVEYEGEAPDYIINHWKTKMFLDELILTPFKEGRNPKEIIKV